MGELLSISEFTITVGSIIMILFCWHKPGQANLTDCHDPATFQHLYKSKKTYLLFCLLHSWCLLSIIPH